MEEQEYSPAFYCPISHEVMVDPVNAPDGRTYERQAIEAWLNVNPISPFTRAPMFISSLVTNYSLRSDIEAARIAVEKAGKVEKQKHRIHFPIPLSS